jgi:D-alanyl-lipoteichoic acid acyltransferase DltB (MBOAT superfamily)
MFFNSFGFLGFLLIVLVILHIERYFSRNVIVRNVTLLLASYFFYGYFNIGFTLILAFITLVNYFAGQLLFNKNLFCLHKIICGTAIVISLVPLVFYKYALFVIKSFSTLLSFEINFELLNGILLPVGISFFTFQALSYTIDVYREKITERPTLLDFALFVSFFPTILSGPIEKARNLLPQIRTNISPNLSNITQGICIFVWGLFKKMVVADRLAYYVDWAYDSAQYVSGTTLAVAAIFYSIQIYCDFSGYSDMALGVAKTVGFNITKNFRQPYFSRTFKEFWRKWHIALTSWFTEYVYFSLGGSHVKLKVRWILNISTIFILSGIWHGAAWNFLIWGILHAVYYLIEHFAGLQDKNVRWNKLTSVLSGLVVFILVTLAWIFFRLVTFDEALHIIGKIITDLGGHFSMGASSFTFVATLFMLLIFVIYELLVRTRILCFDVTDCDSKIINNLLSLIPMIILLGMFGMTSDSFVYFQF